MHDLLMSSNWDLVPNYAGGLTEADDLVIDQQDITYRIRINDPDHLLWSIGANLEDLLGLPNTPATAVQGEAQIKRALTLDGRFNALDITVRGVPIAQNQIQYYIGISSRKGQSASAVVTTIVQL